jgi:beta-phosphoglucomutase-like phosphatase (HAD superfamily)
MPHKKMALPAVLFDLDGTLIDSVYEHVAAWGETLREARLDVPKWMIHRRVGMSGKSMLQELARELSIDKNRHDLDRFERGHDARFRRVIPDLQPLPAANELLDHLHKSKVRIAIATTGNRFGNFLALPDFCRYSR